VADVVASDGMTTVYSTSTVHESTGTYARVIDTVGTGVASGFDGLAFNGRGSLANGSQLAGTYYENFVLTATGYAPVNIVFFQDDSETRRRQAVASTVPASTSASPRPAVASAAPRAIPLPVPSVRPSVSVTPVVPVLRAGIALAADGPTLAAAEVLRGRLTGFWPRAFANDVAIPIRSWRLVSAQPDHVSGVSGSAEPFVAQWVRMPPAGVIWSLRFEIFTELAPTHRLEAQISIAVRSPALVD